MASSSIIRILPENVSNQIAAGEGGIISCKDSKDNQIINSLRSHGWFREKINNKRLLGLSNDR